MFWTDFNSSAGWRSALWSHEDYIAHLESQGKCCPEIFEIVGLRLDTEVPDVLHAIDLGVSAHIVANAFWELLPQFGRNQSGQVKALQQLTKAFYSRNRVASRMEGRLTLDRIRTMSSWPMLKAKAAAVRNLVPFAAELAAQYDSGSLHDKRRLALANDLHEFCTLLGNEGRLSSASALASVQRLGNSVPILYAHLAAEAFHSGAKAWKSVRNSICISTSACTKLHSMATLGSIGHMQMRTWWEPWWRWHKVAILPPWLPSPCSSGLCCNLNSVADLGVNDANDANEENVPRWATIPEVAILPKSCFTNFHIFWKMAAT